MFVHRSFMYHIISSPQITSCTTQKCISFITNPQYLLWSRGHIIHHNCIERLFEYSCQYSDTNRQKEVILSRLLLGRCGLNHYLHQMKRHPTGLCDTCHTKEDIEHYVLLCRDNPAKTVRERILLLNLAGTIEATLGNTELQEVICQYARRRQTAYLTTTTLDSLSQ